MFNKPTQVRFVDLFEESERGRRILGGIVFNDIIICGECGSVIELEDAEIIEVLPWVDISDSIVGN